MRDKALIAQRFSKAWKTYEEYAVVQNQIADNLIVMLQNYFAVSAKQNAVSFGQNGVLFQRNGVSFQRVFEVGCGSGLLTRKMLANFDCKSYIANDIADVVSLPLQVEFRKGDAESMDFPKDISILVSASCIQWFENIGAFFKKAHKALAKDGLMLVSSFGKDNLAEFAALGVQSLDYLSLDELLQMVSEDFEVLDAQEQHIVQWFNSPSDILRSLKATGVNSLGKVPWSKSRQIDFIDQYGRKFCTDGKFSLTYNPIYLMMKKR